MMPIQNQALYNLLPTLKLRQNESFRIISKLS